MKNKSKRLGLILIALTVIIAGCTNGNGEDDADGDGVRITSFDSDSASIVEGQSTNLQLRTINEGGVDAENVVVRLFNLPMGDSDSVWQITQGDNVTTHQGGTLRAGDDDIPAEEGETTWTLDAPEIGSQDRDYSAHGRLYYMYSTEANSDLELVEDDEWDGVQTETGTSNTAGPIEIEVQSRSPIRYFDEEPEESLCLDIRNEGNGTPLHPDALVQDDDGNDRWDTSGYEDEVEVTIDESTGVEFTSQTGDDESNTVTASLTQDRDRQCFDMDLPGDISIRQDVPLSITADYGYAIDESTTLSVESR